MILVTSILALLVVGSVGILGLSLIPRLRVYITPVVSILLGIIFGLVLILRWVGTVDYVISVWRPTAMFRSILVLRVSDVSYPLSFSLILVSLSAVLVGLRDGVKGRAGQTIVFLLGLAWMLVSFWSANPLTLIVGWACFDIGNVVNMILANQVRKQVLHRWIFGTIATLLLWCGAILPGIGVQTSFWTLITPSQAQLVLWGLAGIFRVYAFPFHFSGIQARFEVKSNGVLALLSPIVGWGFWLHLLVTNDGFLPGSSWILILAVLTVAVGGLLAWAARSPEQSLGWLGIGFSGSILLAAAVAGVDALPISVVGSVVWVIGMAILFLGGGLEGQEKLWKRLVWASPVLVASLNLLGAPFTLGFYTQSIVFEGIVQERSVFLGIAFLVGYVFLIAALVRYVLQRPAVPKIERLWVRISYVVGIGALTLVLLGAMFFPSLLIPRGMLIPLGRLFSAPGVIGWVLFPISLVFGALLAWQDKHLRSKIALGLDMLYDFLRFEWLYNVLVGALGRGITLLREADEVIGGAGALLWSLLLLLLILLVWGLQ